MTPESVGIPKSSLILGKHSGRHAFRDRIEETRLHLERQGAQPCLQAVQDPLGHEEGCLRRRHRDDHHGRDLQDPGKIQDGLSQRRLRQHDDSYGHGQDRDRRRVFQEVGFGDGPVDATFKAIQKIIKTNSKLVKFSRELHHGRTSTPRARSSSSWRRTARRSSGKGQIRILSSRAPRHTSTRSTSWNS